MMEPFECDVCAEPYRFGIIEETPLKGDQGVVVWRRSPVCGHRVMLATISSVGLDARRLIARDPLGTLNGERPSVVRAYHNEITYVEGVTH